MPEIIWSPNVQFEGVELIDNENEHRYLVNGRPTPGLTHILERNGLSNYEGVPKAVMDNASKFGSKVHEYVHWYNDDDLDLEALKPYEEYYFPVYGWTQFLADFQFQPLHMEKPMCIKISGMPFCCKPDCFGHGAIGANGDPAFGTVEVKTTSEIMYSASIQTAAQNVAITTVEHPMPPRIVVQLLDQPNQAGKFYKAQFCADALDLKVFTAALLLFYARANAGIK